jgi:hypothetical protein
VKKWLSKEEDYVNPEPTWSAYHEELQEEINALHASRIQAVRSILDKYVDELYTSDIIKKVSWHLAGWEGELREGIAVPRWDGKTLVWAPVYVSSCDRIISTPGKRVYELSLKSLGGPTVSLEWPQITTAARIQSMLREIGLSKYEEHLDTDIGGMYMTVLLRASTKGLTLDDVHVSSSQRTINKKLYKARKQGCTGAFPPYSGKECSSCPIARDMCPLSRISTGYYYTRECKNKHVGYFKDLSSPYCFLCLISGRAKKEKYG